MPSGDNPLMVDLHRDIQNTFLIKMGTCGCVGEEGKVNSSTFWGKKPLDSFR